MDEPCAECGARRGHLWGCGRQTRPLDVAPTETAAAPSVWRGDEEDLRTELRVRVGYVPALLLAFWILSAVPFTALLQRLFAGMWLHELGHASSSWLCGFWAVPLPWFTAWSEERSWAVTVLVLAGLGGVLAWQLRHRRAGRAAALGGLLAAALLLRFGLSFSAARQLILFAGDAGAMVLGALGMATFFARPSSHLVRRGLRWGLAPLGAAAFTDAARVWWEAKKDFAALPFGEQAGAHASDASRLVEDFGWDERALVHRYLAVAAASLLAVALSWALGVWAQRRRMTEASPSRSPPR